MGLSSGYAGPREVHYMFVDGEQLRRTAEEIGAEWFGEPVDIDYRLLQGSCLKVFYYDCLPAKRASIEDAEHAEKHAAKLDFFNKLRALPGWHVSEGLAKHRKRARQEQKEVDILIAVDMLTHTHRKNMHRLTFVSGDQDFAPLLEAVVRDGMYVELLYPQGHTSQDLIHFADVASPMDMRYMHFVSTASFKQRNPLPTYSNGASSSPENCEVIGQGLISGNLFATVWKEKGRKFFDVRAKHPSVGEKQYLFVQGVNECLVKRCFVFWMEQEFGIRHAIEWRVSPS